MLLLKIQWHRETREAVWDGMVHPESVNISQNAEQNAEMGRNTVDLWLLICIMRLK